MFKEVVLFSHLGWFLAVYATGNLSVETAATEHNEVIKSGMLTVTGAGKYMAAVADDIEKEEKKAGDSTQVGDVVHGRKNRRLDQSCWDKHLGLRGEGCRRVICIWESSLKAFQSLQQYK